MNRIYLYLFCLILSLSFSLAHNELENESFESQITALNEQLQGTVLPAPIQSLFGNQRLNIELTDGNNTRNVSVITQEGKIISISPMSLQDPTLIVYSDLETISSLFRSKDPSPELRRAFNEGKITYKAVGFANKVKFSVAFFVARLAGNFNE